MSDYDLLKVISGLSDEDCEIIIKVAAGLASESELDEAFLTLCSIYPDKGALHQKLLTIQEENLKLRCPND